jgi:hypothetical protein
MNFASILIRITSILLHLMTGTAKCVGLDRRIVVLVQKFHIQDQGQIFVECKSSSTPPQSHIISPMPLQRSKENPPWAAVVS